jgi:YNFM family putative membrane transporter
VPGRAVLLLSLAAFASAAALRGSDPLLPLIAGSFDTTPGGASAVITGFALAYGLLQLVSGPTAERIGKYRTVCWVTAISAGGNLLCALAPSLPLLVAARFATGATVGAIVPLALAWIGDAVPYERRQPVLARFLIGHMLGIALSTSAAGFVGEAFGWRAVYVLLSGLYAFAALLLFAELRVNPLTREVRAHAGGLADAFRRMASLFRLPWVRVILAIVFVEGVLLFGATAFIALDLHLRFGLSLGASGSMVATFALGGIAYASVAGRVVPHLGERGLALVGGACIAAGLFGLAAMPTAAWAPACIIVLGLGLYMLHNTLQLHATQMAPEARGGALALFACSLFLGQSLGVWLASLVIDAAGARPVFLAAGIGLFALALDFRRRLARLGRHR